MTLTAIQRKFLMVFVSDGEYNLLGTCQALGVLPSQVMPWFEDDHFQAQLRKIDGAALAAMGYGPLRVVRDVLNIAHSDIGEIQMVSGSLAELPRHVRIAIKKAKFKAMVVDGELRSYPAEIEMHSKEWALKQAADWFDVANAPEVRKQASTGADDGPKRIAGLIVRPPLTQDEKDMEDLIS